MVTPPSKHWAAVTSKLEALLEDYARHLQAPLAAYWLAAANLTRTEAPFLHGVVEGTLWDFHDSPDLSQHVDQVQCVEIFIGRFAV